MSESKPSEPYSSKFIYWVKQNFILLKIAVNEVGCCIKSKKPICI